MDMGLREQQLAIRWVRENIELTYTSIHGDDLTFILDQNSLAVEFSEEEKNTERHMVEYWNNFVGAPSPAGLSQGSTWFPVTPTSKVNQIVKISDLHCSPLSPSITWSWEKIVLAVRAGSGGHQHRLPSDNTVYD